MITKIVYHAPDNATGLLTECPCCGVSLLLDMRLLAPDRAPAASPPPTLPEDGPAAADGLTQPSAAAASGLRTHADCAQYQAYYRGAPNGRCCDPDIGGGSIPANGPACRYHFVGEWTDGNDD